ncbi:MAG: stage III sporulation protein AD [Bacillota bacterium]
MEIFQIVAIAIVGVLIITTVRQFRNEPGTSGIAALPLTLVVAITIFALLLDRLGLVFATLRDLASRANLNFLYLDTVLKIIGIAYVAEFGAQVCRDAQESAVAAKVELAGKVLIMVLAVPIVVAILEVILQLLP